MRLYSCAEYYNRREWYKKLTTLRSCFCAAAATHIRHTVDGGHTVAVARRPRAHLVVAVQSIQDGVGPAVAEHHGDGELAVVGVAFATENNMRLKKIKLN